MLRLIGLSSVDGVAAFLAAPPNSTSSRRHSTT